MKTGKIVCFTMIILLFCAAAWPTGCGTAAGSESREGMPKTASEANGPAAPVSRDEEPAETAPEDTVIHFLDPVIEAETRRILNKPAGDIMKKEVLGITDFGVDREYEDYGSLGKIGSVSGEITTLGVSFVILNYIRLSFMQIHAYFYINYIIYYGLLIFCCQNVATHLL